MSPFSVAIFWWSRKIKIIFEHLRRDRSHRSSVGVGSCRRRVGGVILTNIEIFFENHLKNNLSFWDALQGNINGRCPVSYDGHLSANVHDSLIAQKIFEIHVVENYLTVDHGLIIFRFVTSWSVLTSMLGLDQALVAWEESALCVETEQPRWPTIKYFFW